MTSVEKVVRFAGLHAYAPAEVFLRRRLTPLVLAVLFASAFPVAPVAADDALTVVFEGTDGAGRWSVSVTVVDLAASTPAIAAIGDLEAIEAVTCTDGGFMSEMRFVGNAGEAEVTSAALMGALTLPSDEVLIAAFGGDRFPPCWDDADPITATRQVRVAEVIVDDASGGDGDGFVECAETIHVGLVIASITESLDDAQVVVEVLGTEASLVGPSWSAIDDLDPRSEAGADEEFTIEIAADVAGYDWLTLGVAVGHADGVYESHRHIPIGCGLAGSADDVPSLGFPVVGPNYFKQEWLTTHNPYIHEGTDVFASRMIPVVAVADGVIADVNWAHDPFGQQDREEECCAITLRHDGGWESWYLHLNNDTPGTDDGNGWGVMPGIERGVRVTAGQIIGFIGDSTNAEGTAPHLHYELHDPAGNPIDPYSSLGRAEVIDAVCTATDAECYPFVVLSWNSRDPKVAVLQTRLAEAGFTPGIADGVFGTRTDQAVRAFQAAADLDVDGIVGSVAWDELARVVELGIDLVPGVVARRGDRGPVVIEVQSLLAQRGFSPGPVDGIFGTLTETATGRFQAANSLTSTGVVDAATFDALGATSVPDPAPSTSRLVRLGSTGPVVVEVQSLLAEAGFSPGVIDGIFGSLTDSAVRSFQSASGLTIDGIVGEATLQALGADGAQRVVVARRGDSGPAVVNVQTLLTAAGHSPGPIDGSFGWLTETAVRAFQTAMGFRVDGVVDEATLNALG
jgi:peptidoglycan hydrolase-like protein with peptidoglycan-binding domain